MYAGNSQQSNLTNRTMLPAQAGCPNRHRNFELSVTPRLCCQCECQAITFNCKNCNYSTCSSCESILIHENVCTRIELIFNEMSEKDRNSDLDFRKRRITCIKCNDQTMNIYLKCKGCPWIICNSCFRSEEEEKKNLQTETNQTVNESALCKVCLSQTATYLNQNCGHLSVCRQDAARLNKCPICRRQGRFIQLYSS